MKRHIDKHIDSPISRDGNRNSDISIEGGKREKRRETETGREEQGCV